jgi:hypothetical protein
MIALRVARDTLGTVKAGASKDGRHRSRSKLWSCKEIYRPVR